MKLIFAPIGIAAGLLAGLVAQKGFDQVWSVFDDEEAPAPDQPRSSYPKLIAALVVEGAVFRLTKGLVDHAVRSGFARTTGRWPGEDPSGTLRGAIAHREAGEAAGPLALCFAVFLTALRASLVLIEVMPTHYPAEAPLHRREGGGG